MAYINSFIQDVGYRVNESVDNLYRPRIFYDQASSEYSCSSDTQSSAATTCVMSPDTTMQEDVHECYTTGKPYLEITEEPADEFRFRYQSEMQGAHGAILGKNADKHRKTFPSVKLHNFKGVGIIRCTLATASGLRSVHAHRLVAKLQDKEKEDPHDIAIGPECYEATFQNMVIIHIEKKKVAEVLEQKIKKLLAQRFPNIPVKITAADDRRIKDQVKHEAAVMDMNQVSLKFEALMECENQLVDICPPVYTVPINNLKSHLRGKLKICRIDKHISSCRGGEEVFIFVEKVAKQNIKVKFYELDSDKQEIWFDYAKFGENDVHHQYGIVFRTPPYRTPDITRNAHVLVRLERPSDGGVSDPIEFQYKPDHLLKRRRASSDLPIEDLRLCNKNIARSPHLTSPWRSPDTTGDEIPSEIVQKYINDDDYSLFFDELLSNDQIEENISLPSNPSINDILAKLPTPEAEELRNYLSNFSSSGDFHEYTRAAFEGGLLTESTMLTTDGTDKMTQRTCKIGNITFLPHLRQITQSDYINKGLRALNRVLMSSKRKVFDKDKFSEIVRHFFTYSLDDKENRVLHLVSHEDTEQTLVQFIDFIVQHGLEKYKSELVNIQNSDQQTPLHIAVMEGLNSAVSKLMSSRLADPNKKDKDNKTPLHYAVLYADRCGDKGLKNLQTIIDSRSCNVNEICDDGTALHLALRKKENIEILNMLLQHNELNVNICAGSSRETALHIAVESLEISTVKNLVSKCKEYGKELKMDLKNAAGQTPRNLCTMHEDDEDKEIRAKAEEIEFLLFNEDPALTLSEEDDLEIGSVKPYNKNLDCVLEHLSKQKTSNSNSSDATIIQPVVPESIDLEIKTEEEDTLIGYNEDTGLFDVIALKELKAILDKNNEWEKLALLLGYKNFMNNFRNHPSPTLMLLTYVETYGTNMDMDSDIVNTLLDHLATSKLIDAAFVLDRMLSRKRTKKKKKN